MRLPRPGRRFFVLLDELAQQLVQAAGLCAELYDRFPEAGDRIARLTPSKRTARRTGAELQAALNATFTTPADRDDLLALVTSLGATIDAVRDAADAIDLYRLRTIPERARAQARLVLLASERIGDATARLWRMPDLSSELDDVYALEDEGDRIARDALARLFAGGGEPIDVIRLKSVHDALENALDSAKTTARALESLVLKSR